MHEKLKKHSSMINYRWIRLFCYMYFNYSTFFILPKVRPPDKLNYLQNKVNIFIEKSLKFS